MKKGCTKVTIRTVDTDGMVLAVDLFRKTAPDELGCLWRRDKRSVQLFMKWWPQCFQQSV